jgi:hypothetical protein
MAALGGFTPDQSTFINDTVSQLTAGPYQDVTVNYVLTSAYLVFFMHCGFAMVRPSTPVQVLATICYSSIPTLMCAYLSLYFCCILPKPHISDIVIPGPQPIHMKTAYLTNLVSAAFYRLCEG